MNNVPEILERHESIKQIVVTRQTTDTFWENCFHDTFSWIHQHPEREINVRRVRSPSRIARRGVVGDFCEFVANKWIEQHYSLL
ncbi:hypothetical protein [Spirosoma oryzae]|uniref:hypothetical protein n=1 Tax=Spirosoma oryzae TaxID=1469603 RepID=UPI0011B1EE25|nr:hypothetical protein [Spirosoma oryzae]